jgi:diacylglycerol kinase family enzyme
MKIVKAREAVIRLISPSSGMPEKLQADGDIAGTLPATITVATQPLQVLAPR